MYEEIENLTKEQIENLYYDKMECKTSDGCLYIPYASRECDSKSVIINGQRLTQLGCYFSSWGYV